MTIENYFGDWCKVVDLNEAEKIMKKLVSLKSPTCPTIKNIFKAFELCSLNDLRVLILGQDPYNNLKEGTPVATGVAFANSPDTLESQISPSLEVLRDSIIDFTLPHYSINFDKSLEKWEKQGVLMLNSALSVSIGNPGSHSLLWRPFIKSLLLNLSKNTTGIVYVLMGTSAQSFEPFIDTRFNHIIKVRHPAYYARTKTAMPSDLWQQINNILIGQNGYGIEWYKESIN